MKLFIQVCLVIMFLAFLGISARAGTGGMEQIGACCFLNSSDVPDCEEVTEEFCDIEHSTSGVYSGDGTTCQEVTCGDTGPTVIVPTMSQWGMIFVSIVLGFIGIFALIRERRINQYFN